MDEKKKSTSSSSYSIWDSSYKQLLKYCSNSDLFFWEITPEFIEGFKSYLQHEAKTKSNKLLSKNTASNYFNKFRAVIHKAHDKGIITINPLQDIASIKQEDSEREYLELSELKKLVQTDCNNDVLKRAFLFSCLTGMRWSEIKNTDDGYRVVFHQKKTKGLQHLDLSVQAYSLMGERVADRVFTGLRYSSYNNTELLRWCLDAGVSKQLGTNFVLLKGGNSGKPFYLSDSVLFLFVCLAFFYLVKNRLIHRC